MTSRKSLVIMVVIVSFVADRFDVILNANNKEGKYAVTLRGVGSDCKGITYSTILRYKNATASAIKPANNDPKPNYGVVSKS